MSGGRPARARPSHGRGAAGVTFIELVLVLGLMAVAAAIAAPMVGRGAETLRLRSEAGRVAALLRDARQHAVTRRQPTRVTLDRVHGTVTLEPATADRPRRTVALPPGLRLSVQAGGESLTFSARGLTRETRWLLEGAGDRRLVIGVEAVSGRVSVGPEPAS